MTVLPGNGCAAALGIDAGLLHLHSPVLRLAERERRQQRHLGRPRRSRPSAPRRELPLKGGDCVTVEDGTYDETVDITTSGSADTCTGYVVFRAASQGGAKIVSTDQYQGCLVNASYVMVDGFDMQDTSTGSAFVAGTNTVVGGQGRRLPPHRRDPQRGARQRRRGPLGDPRGLHPLRGQHGLQELRHEPLRRQRHRPLGGPGVGHGAGLPHRHPQQRLVPERRSGTSRTRPTARASSSTPSTTPTRPTARLPTTSSRSSRTTWSGATAGAASRSAGAGPTSYVTFRNNTVFDNNRQQLPWPGAEIQSMGNHNAFYDNIAIVGPDEKDGPNGSGSTVALQDACGTQGGVPVTTGSVWEDNIAFSMLTGNRLTYGSCPAPISATANMLGVDPALSAPSLSATTRAGLRHRRVEPRGPRRHGDELRPVRLRLHEAPEPPVDRRVRALARSDDARLPARAPRRRRPALGDVRARVRREVQPLPWARTDRRPTFRPRPIGDLDPRLRLVPPRRDLGHDRPRLLPEPLRRPGSRRRDLGRRRDVRRRHRLRARLRRPLLPHPARDHHRLAHASRPATTRRRTTYALHPYPPNAVSGDVPALGGYGLGLDVWVDGLPPGVPSQAALAVETRRERRRGASTR